MTLLRANKKKIHFPEIDELLNHLYFFFNFVSSTCIFVLVSLLIKNFNTAWPLLLLEVGLGSDRVTLVCFVPLKSWSLNMWGMSCSAVPAWQVLALAQVWPIACRPAFMSWHGRQALPLEYLYFFSPFLWNVWMIFFDKLMEGERISHLINSFRLASKDLIVEIHFARSAFTFCFGSTL